MRFIVLFLSQAALAADLTGMWIGQVPGRNNEPQDIAFKLVHTGTTISGKLYGDYQSSPITEGKVTGDQIVFVVTMQEQAGNQINQTRLRFTGSIKDGDIELTRERESSRNAGNGGGTQTHQNTPARTFSLKRLT